MTIETRRYLFYGLCAAFLVIGSGVIFYAQGWRLDFGAFTIKKVGGIYIRSFPDSARIFLNGKSIENKSGILSRGTFVGNIFPKNYKLALTADGYRDWEEHISVKPSLVAEIKHAVLVSSAPEKISTSPVENFWIVNGELAIQNQRGRLTFRGKPLAGTRIIGSTSDAKKVLAKDDSRNAYFIIDASSDSVKITDLDLLVSGARLPAIRRAASDPADNNRLLLQGPRSISTLDIASGRLSLLETSSTISAWAASPSWFVWANFDAKNDRTRLVFYNRAAQTGTDETVSGDVRKFEFRNDNELGVLRDDNSFSIKKMDERKTDAIASDVKDFVFSPDGNFAAALENESLEIFSLNAENEYWRFRLPDAGAVERLEWYRDNAHLFVVYPDETRFLDLNDKALENFPAVASGDNVRYDVSSNTFYFAKDGVLWSLAFPK